MSKKPAPATESMTREEAKAARKAAWKRESKKTDRVKAKKDRVSDWEEMTGLKWDTKWN